MLTILGEFFTRPFVRLSLNTKIVNEVFDFEGGDNKEELDDSSLIEIFQEDMNEKITSDSIKKIINQTKNRVSIIQAYQTNNEQPLRDATQELTQFPLIQVKNEVQPPQNNMNHTLGISVIAEQQDNNLSVSINPLPQIKQIPPQNKEVEIPLQFSITSIIRANSQNPPTSYQKTPTILSQQIHPNASDSADNISIMKNRRTTDPNNIQRRSASNSSLSSTSSNHSNEVVNISITQDKYRSFSDKIIHSQIERDTDFTPISINTKSNMDIGDEERQNSTSLPPSRIFEATIIRSHHRAGNHSNKKRKSILKIPQYPQANHTPLKLQKCPETKKGVSYTQTIDTKINDSVLNEDKSVSFHRNSSSFHQSPCSKNSKHNSSPIIGYYPQKYPNSPLGKGLYPKIRILNESSDEPRQSDILISADNNPEQNTPQLNMQQPFQGSKLQDFELNDQNKQNSEQKMVLDFQRNKFKRHSAIEKTKLFALTQLMDSYQNQKVNPENILKDTSPTKKKEINPDNVFKQLFRQGKVLKMKFFDYILYHLQCFNTLYSEKKKQITFSKQKVKERLDVVYIIQKLVEIDKLKMLLLNEDQLKLFEYLPKPIVHFNPNEIPSSSFMKNSPSGSREQQRYNMLEQWSVLHQQKKPIEKAIEASRVYQDMMDKKEEKLTTIDRKLIDMLDIRIKEIFDVNNTYQRQKKIVNTQNLTDIALNPQITTPNQPNSYLDDSDKKTIQTIPNQSRNMLSPPTLDLNQITITEQAPYKLKSLKNQFLNELYQKPNLYNQTSTSNAFNSEISIVNGNANETPKELLNNTSKNSNNLFLLKDIKKERTGKYKSQFSESPLKQFDKINFTSDQDPQYPSSDHLNFTEKFNQYSKQKS